MSNITEKLKEFHCRFGVPVGEVPKVPSDDRVRLRLRLIAEEFFELLEACLDENDHIAIHHNEEINSNGVRVLVEKLIATSRVNVSLPDAADALIDTSYVVEGACLEFGIDSESVFEEVHQSNMRKEGGPTRDDGKILKPLGWKAPDIEGVLRGLGWKP